MARHDDEHQEGKEGHHQITGEKSRGADEQHPDAQGRITLSAEHRRYANLSKECVVTGSLGHLEIWDAQAWQQYQETHEETFSAASDDTLRDII